MPCVGGRFHAAHRLPTARELELGSSGLRVPRFMRLTHHLWQLSQHIGNVVPQPAHTSQSRPLGSADRAMRASYGTTGWACKAPDHAADLARRWSARRSLHRDLVGPQIHTIGDRIVLIDRGDRRPDSCFIFDRGDRRPGSCLLGPDYPISSPQIHTIGDRMRPDSCFIFDRGDRRPDSCLLGPDYPISSPQIHTIGDRMPR